MAIPNRIPKVRIRSARSAASTTVVRAVNDTAACGRALDLAADGSFAQWLRARHDDDPFEKEIADGVTEWFGN
ncbi:MAG TPA: hypothetical protein VIK31_06760 [Propionibacteriaceae bacterium]